MSPSPAADPAPVPSPAPARRRSRRARITRRVVVGLVVVAVVVVTLLSNDRLLTWAARAGAASAGLELEGAVRHDLLAGRIALEGVRVGAPGLEPWLRVDSIELTYSPWDLLRSEVRLGELRVRTPIVRLVRLEDGSFEGFDVFASDGAEPEPPPSPAGEPRVLPAIPVLVVLSLLELDGGSFEMLDRGPGEDVRVDALSLRGHVDLALPAVEVDLAASRLAYGSLGVGPLAAETHLGATHVRIDRLDLQGVGGRLEATGGFDRATDGVELELSAQHLGLAELLAAFDVPADVPDPVDLEASVEGEVTGELAISLSVDAPYRQAPLSLRGAAVASTSSVRDLSLEGTWGDARVDASGDVDLEQERVDARLVVEADTLQRAAAYLGMEELSGAGLEVRGRVEGALAEPAFTIETLRLGSAHFLDVDLEGLEGGGEVELLTGEVRAKLGFASLAGAGVELGAGSLDVEGDPERLTYRIALGEVLSVEGDYGVEDGRLGAEGRIDGLSLRPFLSLAGITWAEGAIGSGSFHVVGKPDRIETLVGEGQLDGVRLGAHGLAAVDSGRLAVSLRDGVARAEGRVGLGTTSIDVSGAADLLKQTAEARARAALHLADAEELALAMVPELRALGGDLALDVSIDGPWAEPVVDLRAEGGDFGVRLALGGGDPDEPDEPDEPTDAKGGKGAASAEGMDGVADAADEGEAQDGDAVAASEPGTGAPAPGELVARVDSIDVRLQGPALRPSGTASLAGGEARAFGRAARELVLEVRLDAGTVHVDRLACDVGGLPLSAEGTLAADGGLDLALSAPGATFEAVPDLAAAELAGPLELAVAVTGTRTAPVVEADLEAAAIEYQGRALGRLAVTAKVEGDTIHAEVELPDDGVLEADVRRQGEGPAEWPLSARLDVPDFQLDPFVRAFADTLPPAVRTLRGRVGVSGAIRGEGASLDRLEGRVGLDRLDVSLGKLTVSRVEGGGLVLADRVATLEPTRLRVGDEGIVAVAGRYGGDGARFAIEELDLPASMLASFGKDIKATGRLTAGGARPLIATVELAEGKPVPGTLDVSGTVEARIPRLDVRALGQPVRDLALVAHLQRDRVVLETLRASLGDGTLELGKVDDAGPIENAVWLDPPAPDRIVLEFVQLPYRIPKTLRVLTSGRLSVTGSRETPERMRVGGTVRLDEVLYERDVALLDGLIRPIEGGAPRGGPSATAPDARLEGITLDLEIQSSESIIVRNNVAKIVLAADLRAQGTAAAPRVLGEVRVAEGKLLLFGKSFDVEQGNVAFNDPEAIDPELAIRAKTRVEREDGDVDVVVDLGGRTSEGYTLVLSSSPAYPEEDVVFLLLTGKTRAEAMAGGGGGDTSGLPLMALSLLGGDIVKEELGLSEFELEGTEGGGAKVTVGKRLSDRVQVRAVNELGGAASNVSVAVEYQLTDHVLLVARPDTTGSFGAEVRYRLRFR